MDRKKPTLETSEIGETPLQKFATLVEFLGVSLPVSDTLCLRAVSELKKIIHEHQDGQLNVPTNVHPGEMDEAVAELVENIAAPSHIPKRRRSIHSITSASGTQTDDSDTSLNSALKSNFLSNLENNQKFDPFHWDFDMHQLAKTTPKPLTHMVFVAIDLLDIISEINVEESILSRYSQQVERGYRSKNAYHNRLHAADVVQATGHFLLKGMASNLSAIERFSMIISAAIHDLDHPGVNNNFLVAVGDFLALQYNDISPLENHHVAEGFLLMSDPVRDITRNMEVKQKKRFRHIVINSVLATDMARSFEVIGQFNNIILDDPEKNFDWESSDHVDSLMQMVLKMGDVSHPARKFEAHYKWSIRCIEEFYSQGDQEKEKGLPVLGFMDREIDHLPKSQIGFLTYVVIPMYKPMASFFPALVGPLMTNISDNIERWKEYLTAGDMQKTPINQDLVDELNGSKYDCNRIYAPVPSSVKASD
jgi:hypothetical protein